MAHHLRMYSGFITGQRINRVSLEAEAWFWRILGATDKDGCVPANIGILRSLTAGLRQVRRAQVRRWVSELVAVDLLEPIDEHLHVVDFERTQSKATLNGTRPAISDQVRRDVLSIGYCAKCKTDQNLSVDHVQPVSRGGSDARENLQCLCLPCNIAKSNKWEAVTN